MSLVVLPQNKTFPLQFTAHYQFWLCYFTLKKLSLGYYVSQWEESIYCLYCWLIKFKLVLEAISHRFSTFWYWLIKHRNTKISYIFLIHQRNSHVNRVKSPLYLCIRPSSSHPPYSHFQIFKPSSLHRNLWVGFCLSLGDTWVLKNHTSVHFYCPFLKLSPHFHSLADT